MTSIYKFFCCRQKPNFIHIHICIMGSTIMAASMSYRDDTLSMNDVKQRQKAFMLKLPWKFIK